MMRNDSGSWLPCSTCKGDLGFDEVYYLCSVSTCQRSSMNLRFCSVDCWEAHVPVMRHRDAWAEEARSPTAEEWARENPEPSGELDRRTLGLRGKLAWLRAHARAAIGFGAAGLLLCAVPVVNLFALPVLVVAGTLLVLRSERG